MLQKKLNKNHDEMAIYLLDIYEIYIQQSSDFKDIPHLKNTTPNQNIDVNCSINTPDSIEFERTLTSIKFIQDEKNKVTVNDGTKMNESLPYDDLDFVLFKTHSILHQLLLTNLQCTIKTMLHTALFILMKIPTQKLKAPVN